MVACLTSGGPGLERPPVWAGQAGNELPMPSTACVCLERGGWARGHRPFCAENQVVRAVRKACRLLRSSATAQGRRERSQRDRHVNPSFSQHNANACLVTKHFLSGQPNPSSPLVEMALLKPPPLLLGSVLRLLPSHWVQHPQTQTHRAPRSCSLPAP